jgi:hypothetical protein
MTVNHLSIRTVVLAAALCAALHVNCFAAVSPDQSAFQAVLSKLDAAEKRLDIDTWSKIMRAHCAKDVIFVLPGSPPLGLEAEIAAERALFESVTAVPVDREVVTSMTVRGSSADATAAYSIAIVQNGVAQRQTDTVKYTLVRAQGSWLIQSVDIRPAPPIKLGQPPRVT